MAEEPNRFAALMERVAQGDDQAAAELFDQYREALIFVIRQRLKKHSQLRTQLDSTDILQDVWQDVFAHPEKLREFATFEPFLKYLAGMVCHKVEKAQRKFAAQKRDLHRRRHLSDPGAAVAAATVADPQPGPAQQAASHEAWDRWIESLSERQRQIVFMHRDGHSYQEIAAELGCSERCIRRIVAEMRDMLQPSL